MYYNQRDYPHIPYPSSANPTATISSGGCGVCCGSTILSIFGMNEYPPEILAPIFIKRGARVSSGTDMRRAIEIICELGGFTYRTSSSEIELVNHLQNNGLAIANVDGDAGAKGIFSTQGHYICVVGVRTDGQLLIYDVGDYPSKYNDPYRSQYVKRYNELLICTTDTLDLDTKHRTPNYYLITKEDDVFTYDDYVEYMKRYEAEKRNQAVSSWAEVAWNKGVEAGIFDGTMPRDGATREQLALILDRLGLLDPANQTEV